MKKAITLALAAASAVALTACGSSGSSGTNGLSAGSSASSGGGNTIAGKLIFGGPPELKTRADGLPGLQQTYGVTFSSYKSLDAGGPLTINALTSGQIDAGDIFTTDPSIQANGFVVLQDPKNLYTAQNVLPLINKAKATPGVTATLKAVSDKLDTPTLTSLDAKVITDKKDPAQVAKDWLGQQGLDKTGTAAAGVSLKVGSANFQENVLLADIYAAALQAQGADVTTRLNIGSREAYIPGLKDGSIDLLPEYSGVLLQYFDPKATAVSSADVFAALQKATPAPLTVLDQSAAQDADAIVVTKATAAKYHLTSIADLAKNG
ncbi:glycine betaine ABC transporter substrate-binding protein [Kitasatospora azatica]|uniref:glycine betaine ABC transporter substrate-binding protein n=1 Tax=Kitasatospora azatica TaxID=58347 RepID=UPI000691BCFD|nr:glycine betaine ABC transporter substrate-binding protein [Kitasatospora azatica]